MSIFRTFALCVALPMAVNAQNLDDVARGEFLPGWRNADGNHMAALRIELAPGWKTYWRAPGDAGIPPHFDWSGSENLAGFTPSWPVPEVFWINGLRSIGYQDELIIPMAFQPKSPGEDIDLSAQIQIGVCEEICIPYMLDLAVVLDATQTSPDPRISAALADRPLSAKEAGLREVTCELRPIDDGMQLEARLTLPQLGAEEEAAVELSGEPVWVSEPDLRREGDHLYAIADLVPPTGEPFALERSALRFTIFSDGKAVDIRGCG